MPMTATISTRAVFGAISCGVKIVNDSPLTSIAQAGARNENPT